MALAETAKLIATLDLGGNFVKSMGSATKSLGAFDARIDKTQSKAFQAGQHIGIGIKSGAVIAAAGVGLLVTNIGLGLRSLVELEQQQAQTNAVLKSTKGAAGVSATAVTNLAEKYESLNAIVGDEVIRSTENMLLTFTNVKSKAFEPALKAILDMNTAMGKGPEGLTSTAIQVGKALNDPAKGFTALQRVGVTFDKTQQKRIKSLVKEGKVYEAQKIILAELNKEFGGSFLAQGNTTAGKVAKFNDAIEDLQRTLAAGLLPVVSNVADALSKLLQDPATIREVENLGKSIAAFFTPENIAKGINLLKSGFSAIKAIATPILEIVKKVVSAFQALPPDVQKFLIGAVALNKLTGGGVVRITTDIAGGAITAIERAIVGGVAGGVGGGVAKALAVAGLGKFFVQPVFVTNPGFGTGGPGLPNALPAAGAGAGAVATIAGAAAQGAVMLAPVSVAAIGLAVDQAVDPNDSLKAIATAETAMGRGIADWNNKGIATLQQIAANTGDTTAIEWLQSHGLMLSSQAITDLSDTFDRRKPGFSDQDPTLQDSFDRAVVPVTEAIGVLDDSFDRAVVPTTNAVESADRSIGRLDQTTSTGTGIVQSQVMRSGAAGVAATNSGTSQIVGAINSIPAPITNIYVSGATVRRETTRNDRGGSSSDDRYRNGDPNGPGNPGR